MHSKLRERGAINVLLIPLILLVLFFIGAGAFGFWAFGSRQDYKNNTDQKISEAVTKAVQAEDTKKTTQFAQDEKKPLKAYTGPAAYGGVQLSYPKTWSGYVNEDPNGTIDVDGYFHPGVVPDLQAQNSAYALRVQVLNESYSSVLQDFSSYIEGKTVTATPYKLPKVTSVVGTRLDGEIIQNKQGSMIVLPLRDKTLKIWTEASQFVPDLNNNILPNFSFSP